MVLNLTVGLAGVLRCRTCPLVAQGGALVHGDGRARLVKHWSEQQLMVSERLVFLKILLTNVLRSAITRPLGRSAGERGSRNSSQLPRATARFVGDARHTKCLQRLRQV